MAVYGPVFICMLATYPWQPGKFDRNTAFPLAMCQDLIRMQAVTLFEKHFKPRLACCHCGQPSSAADEGSSICRTKVHSLETFPCKHCLTEYIACCPCPLPACFAEFVTIWP